jgi:anti-sigma regulatory factor (Ser/Thr protein kinase)
VRQTDFHHEAFFYGDVDEFLAGAIPFLREGLDAGEAAMVAVGRSRTDALRAELNGEAEQVCFVDMEALGRNPARIIPAWQGFVEEGSSQDRPLRGIGEPVWPGRSEAEVEECQRHEWLLNHAFWDGPAWRLLCPYDSSALDDEVLSAALDSHSMSSGTWGSPDAAVGAALDPSAVAPFAGVLPASPAAATVFDFSRITLYEARERVRAAAAARGLSADRTFDLVAAVGELTANSILHGGGRGVLSLWEEEGAVVAEVADAGLIEEPLIGRTRPAPSQLGGRGLWMVNQLCDLVQVRSGSEGTTVRLRMAVA